MSRKIDFASMGPAFIKVNLAPSLNSDQTIEDVEKNLKSSTYDFKQIKELNEWTNENGFMLIVKLDYEPNEWRSREALNILTIANDYEITNCYWQLGTGKSND